MSSPTQPQYLCECGHPSQEHEVWPRCAKCKCRKWKEDRQAPFDVDAWLARQKEKEMASRAKSKKASKKTAKSKVKAKASAKAKVTTRGRGVEFDESLTKKVVSLRDNKELTWGDIAANIKSTPGKAMVLYERANLSKKDLLNGTDDEVGKAIVRLRDKEKVSEIGLVARTGFSLSKIHRLYEEHSGKAWGDSRIGKGGRHANGTAPKAKSKTKVAASSKTKAKAGAKARGKAASGSADLGSMKDSDLAAAIEGKTIVVQLNGGKPKKIGVYKVSKVGKSSKTGVRAVAFTDTDQKSRVIAIDTITAVK